MYKNVFRCDIFNYQKTRINNDNHKKYTTNYDILNMHTQLLNKNHTPNKNIFNIYS